MADIEIIRIIWTEQDVRDTAKDYDIDPDLALGRALEWAKHIAETASNLISEQLTNVIRYDNP